MTLAQLIQFFDARIIGSWSPAEWAVVLEKIKANRGRYGIGQWVICHCYPQRCHGDILAKKCNH